MNKSLEETIEEILEIVYEKGEEKLDKKRVIFFNKKNLITFFNSSLAQYKREIREKIKKMKVPSYPAEGPQAGEMTVMARMGYQDAISDALKEL